MPIKSIDRVKSSFAKTPIILLSILICAFAFRLYHIDQYDLWFDELGSTRYTLQSLTASSPDAAFLLLLRRMENDPHSPLYYFFVYLYSHAFGDGKSLRFLSVFFSMLSLGIFYKISRLFFNRRTSILALLIMALHPLHIWYAQEARAYATAVFFSLLMLYTFLQAVKTDRLAYWIFFPITGILAFYSSYHSGFLLLSTGSLLIFKNNRTKIGKWALSSLTVAGTIFFARPILDGQFNVVGNNFWLTPPTANSLLKTAFAFSLGYSETVFQYYIGTIVFGILIFYSIYSFSRTDKKSAFFLGFIVFFPIAAIYFFSKTIAPVYIIRQLIIFSPICYLLIANGIEKIRYTYVRLFVIFFVGISLTIALHHSYQKRIYGMDRQLFYSDGIFPKKNYTGLLTFLRNELKESDIITATDLQSYVILSANLFSNNQQRIKTPSQNIRFVFYPSTINHFDARFLKIFDLIKQIPPDEFPYIHELTLHENDRLVIRAIQPSENTPDRLWLVSSTWFLDQTPCRMSGLNKEPLIHNLKNVLSKTHDGICLELYERNTP